MHGMNININLGNQHPQMHGMGMGGPMGMNQGMMAQNPMMQMMQMLLQIMMSIVGGQMGQMGMGAGHPMPFGNPGFGGGGGMPMGGCGCGGAGPMGNFLGGGGNYGGSYGGGMPMGGPQAPVYNGPLGNAGPGGQGAVATARQFLGQRSRDIRGRMPHFRAAGGLTNNCADFVSSALRSGGMLGGHEVNCRRLEQRLIREGWRQIHPSQAGPGDVVFSQSRGHVELAQGGGRTIGSNNVRQGLQYVTERNIRNNQVVYTRR